MSKKVKNTSSSMEKRIEKTACADPDSYRDFGISTAATCQELTKSCK